MASASTTFVCFPRPCLTTKNLTIRTVVRSPSICNITAVGKNAFLSAQSNQKILKFSQLDTSNMLLRQRIVFLGSPVDDVSADLIISQMLLLDAEDNKTDIKLFINSPGGSVTAGMGIYDTMKLCRADISTICFGLAASMGAFLLASGTKGKRLCMPNARVMIHQPHGGAGGKVMEMGIQIREMMYHRTKLNKILARVTGKPESQIEVDTDRDNFMSAWEARDYGLVDTVIDDGKPGLVAPVVDLVPPPKTRIWDMWRSEGGREEGRSPPSEHRFLKEFAQNCEGEPSTAVAEME